MEKEQIHIRVSKEIYKELSHIQRKYNLKTKNQLMDFIIKSFIYSENNKDQKLENIISKNNDSMDNVYKGLLDTQETLESLIEIFKN